MVLAAHGHNNGHNKETIPRHLNEEFQVDISVIEQLTLNQRARGSSPRRPTIFFNGLGRVSRLSLVGKLP